MIADLTPAQRRAVMVRTNSTVIAETAQVLREVGRHDHAIDARRAAMS